MNKLHEAMEMLLDKLTGRLLADQPQYQPYLSFWQPHFQSTFPQLHQQPYCLLIMSTNNLALPEKKESDEAKILLKLLPASTACWTVG